jgi:hypothetical protein
MTWLALKLLAGNALSAVWAFLGKLSFWQALCIALAIFGLVQTVRVHSEQRHSHKLEAQIGKLSDQLQSISSKRDEQGRTSEKTVTQVIRGQDRVRTVVKTIHDAPNPPDCRTPGIQTLREVL